MEKNLTRSIPWLAFLMIFWFGIGQVLAGPVLEEPNLNTRPDGNDGPNDTETILFTPDGITIQGTIYTPAGPGPDNDWWNLDVPSDVALTPTFTPTNFQVWLETYTNSSRLGGPTYTELSSGSSYNLLASSWYSITIYQVGVSGNWYNYSVSFATTTLPVTWMGLQATPLSTGIELIWETAREENNHFFEVMRSEDHEAWEALGTLPGAGNTTEVQSYTFQDAQPLQGTTYYRIKQVDYDGNFSFSAELSVESSEFASAFRFYPNPARSSLNLSPGIIRVDLYTPLGQLVRRYDLSEGQTTLSLDLAPGTYLLSAQHTDGQVNGSMLRIE